MTELKPGWQDVTANAVTAATRVVVRAAAAAVAVAVAVAVAATAAAATTTTVTAFADGSPAAGGS